MAHALPLVLSHAICPAEIDTLVCVPRDQESVGGGSGERSGMDRCPEYARAARQHATHAAALPLAIFS